MSHPIFPVPFYYSLLPWIKHKLLPTADPCKLADKPHTQEKQGEYNRGEESDSPTTSVIRVTLITIDPRQMKMFVLRDRKEKTRKEERKRHSTYGGVTLYDGAPVDSVWTWMCSSKARCLSYIPQYIY